MKSSLMILFQLLSVSAPSVADREESYERRSFSLRVRFVVRFGMSWLALCARIHR